MRLIPKALYDAIPWMGIPLIHLTFFLPECSSSGFLEDRVQTYEDTQKWMYCNFSPILIAVPWLTLRKKRVPK